ncbi:MAG: PorT family protein [Chitinispirillales bacterium]|jgi:hypothetical protein|nr:PorT family protein [Chitinispirillales bacterium]
MSESQAGSYGLGRGAKGRATAGALGAALAAGIIIALGGLGADASAQGVGIRLGYNYSDMYMRYSTFGRDVEWRRSGTFRGNFGYHAGLSVDIPISEVDIQGIPYMFGLNPCVMFVSKGGKNTGNIYWVNASNQRIGTAEYTIEAYYVDVPLPLSFKREFTGYSVRAEFGPYVSVGLFGKQELKVNLYSGAPYPPYTQDTFSDEGLERIDAGLFYGVIVEFGKVIFLGVRAGSSLTDDSINAVYVTLGYNINF